MHWPQPVDTWTAPTRELRHTSLPPAVQLVDVTKSYPGRRDRGMPPAAVDRISLTVHSGEVFGLLGPNGAGKSTTIRMIATLLEPTSGRLRVCGYDTRRQEREVRRMLGVALGGERSVYWKLTARQNLQYFAALHGLSRSRSARRVDEVLRQLDIADRADDHVEDYSTGMRQRLVVARALLHRPRVVLLDEPSSGLDPQATRSLREHILQLRATGHTILLTTHDMTEADALCDRLAFIDHGRVVAEGTPAGLKAQLGATQVVRAALRSATPDALGWVAADLGDSASWAVADGGRSATLTLWSGPGTDPVPVLISVAVRRGVEVVRVENEPVSLNDVFLALVGRRLDADQAER